MKTIIAGEERKTRFVTSTSYPLAYFTELVLIPEERKKLDEVKDFLIGTEVTVSPESFNSSGHSGKIVDIRIIVYANGTVHPAAIINFASQDYYRLRCLNDLVSAGNLCIDETKRQSIKMLVSAVE